MLCRRHIDIAIHPVIFYIQQWESRPYFHDLTFKCRALSKEASSTILKVFGMTWPGIEPTTSHTPGEHSNTGPPGVVSLSLGQPLPVLESLLLSIPYSLNCQGTLLQVKYLMLQSFFISNICDVFEALTYYDCS